MGKEEKEERSEAEIRETGNVWENVSEKAGKSR